MKPGLEQPDLPVVVVQLVLPALLLPDAELEPALYADELLAEDLPRPRPAFPPLVPLNVKRQIEIQRVTAF